MRANRAYQPMTVADLALHLGGTQDSEIRWRLIAEFLEEYRHEPKEARIALLSEEPPGTGDER